MSLSGPDAPAHGHDHRPHGGPVRRLPSPTPCSVAYVFSASYISTAYADFVVNVGGSGLTAQLTPFLTSIAARPERLSGGRQATVTVELSAEAGSGGFAVDISSDDPALAVPSRVFIPQGQRSVTVDVATAEGRYGDGGSRCRRGGWNPARGHDHARAAARQATVVYASCIRDTRCCR